MCYISRREHEQENSLKFYQDLANVTQSLFEVLRHRLLDLELALANRNKSDSRSHEAQAQAFEHSASLAQSSLDTFEILQSEMTTGSLRMYTEMSKLSVLIETILQRFTESSESKLSKIDQQEKQLLANLQTFHETTAEKLVEASNDVTKIVNQGVVAIKYVIADLDTIPIVIETLRTDLQALSDNEIASIATAIVENETALKVLARNTMTSVQALKVKAATQALNNLQVFQNDTAVFYEQSKLQHVTLLNNQADAMRGFEQVVNLAYEHVRALNANLSIVEAQIAAWNLKTSLQWWIIFLLCPIMYGGSALMARLGLLLLIGWLLVTPSWWSRILQMTELLLAIQIHPRFNKSIAIVILIGVTTYAIYTKLQSADFTEGSDSSQAPQDVLHDRKRGSMHRDGACLEVSLTGRDPCPNTNIKFENLTGKDFKHKYTYADSGEELEV